MNLGNYERKRFISKESPIEYLANLSSYLKGPNIYINRDDKLNLSVGGNKVRKLEFLMADAISNGEDTIFTCGAVQSNQGLLTLGASIKENMDCYLVLEERVPHSYNVDVSGTKRSNIA